MQNTLETRAGHKYIDVNKAHSEITYLYTPWPR